MKKILFYLTMLLVYSTIANAQTVGEKAPEIKISKWMKSEPNMKGKKVFLEFWATWCGPCKMIAPIIEELAVEMEGKVKIFKMDVDSNPNVPIEYGIRSIPTLLIFKNGELADTIVGAVPKKQIVERLNAHL